MREDRLSFPQQIAAASHFEAAARTTLEALVGRCESALRSSAFAKTGRILRAMVHIRPEEAYVRIFVLDHGMDAKDGASYVASATAFGWVRLHGAPIAIDVHTGVVETLGAQTSSSSQEESLPSWGGAQSRIALLGRQATHMLVLPLKRVPDRVGGMISIEADCRRAMGTPFIWPEVIAFAEEIAARAEQALFTLPTPPKPSNPYLPVIGPTMRDLVDMLRVFAEQNETLLLSGPTGAGKSRLARYCHATSPRQQAPFEVLDLATIPEDLQMAELFGWRRGAFTGAARDSLGALGRAEGGTLFIDEIDKLSLKAQAGLLRVLEDRSYRALGDDARERHANVRFIVGTNADLAMLVRAGLFREDLFFRIHVLPVAVPKLADRRDEIVAWAEYMLDRRNKEADEPREASLTEEAKQRLLQHPWPGNLRQLDNILRRAYALFLVEAKGAKGPIAIDARHVERALSFEKGDAENESLVSLLHAAAKAFVRAAQTRPNGAPLSLDWTTVLSGFVLGAAVQKLGDADKAFSLLGKEKLVQHRNHTKALKREIARVEELYALLGEGPSPFAGLADDDKAEDDKPAPG